MKSVQILVLLLTFIFTFPTEAGKICRSITVKHAFDVSQGYPKGRKGYVVDHWCPLSCNGIDTVTNMVYQTIVDAKAKDRWETTPKGCSILCNASNSTPTRLVFNCR